MRRTKLASCLLTLAVALLPTSAPAQTLPPGTTITVTTGADELATNGQCSLREAIQAANTDEAVDTCPAGTSGLDVISLPARTYTLSRANQTVEEGANRTGDLDIYTSMRIVGAGRDQTIIDAARIDRLLDITYLDGLPIPDVTISGVTLRNGANPVPVWSFDILTDPAWSASYSGGAIRNAARLVIENSRLTGNQAQIYGGAILSITSLQLVNSQVTTNTVRLDVADSLLTAMIEQVATLRGGAIVSSDTLTISGSAIDDNLGGGIINVGGGGFDPASTATISASTVSRNRNERASGGGILNAGGTLVLTGSQVSGNYALGGGAGIATASNPDTDPPLSSLVTISGSTIAGNQTGDQASGGGIVVTGDDPEHRATNAITITSSLISDNRAGVEGGGIVISDTAALLLLEGSTVSGNRADANQDGAGRQGFGYGGIANSGSATIRDSTVSGNRATANTGHGGGIGNSGTLTISGGAVRDNQAIYAGGVFNTHSGSITATGVTIANNSGTFTGGGVRNDGSLTIVGGTISGNSALGDPATNEIDDIARGGGVFNLGTLTVRAGTRITGNSALLGGGIANATCTISDPLLGLRSLPGQASLQDSTLSGNLATLWGGAIANEGALSVAGATLSANQTFSDHDLKGINNDDQPYTIPAAAAGIGGALINGIETRFYGRAMSGLCSPPEDLPEARATIEQSTIDQNYAAQGAGGVANYMTMAITATAILSNTTRNFAGGVHNAGALSVTASRIAENRAEPDTGDSGTQGRAGGLHNDAALAISDSAVVSNTASLDGGGLYNGSLGDSLPDYLDPPWLPDQPARLAVTATTIAGNRAGRSGGGLFATEAGSSVSIARSALYANEAGHGGGAIDTDTSLDLTNTTLSGNTAGALGGGLSVHSSGVVTATFVTITANRLNATSDLGPQLATLGQVSLDSSILVEAGARSACAGQARSLGHNLLSAACASPAASDQVGAAPLLGPLANNGGGTLTHALLPGSPAIDAGGTAADPSTDQRGAARPTDGDGDCRAHPDSGAYEAEGQPPAGCGPTPQIYLPSIIK